MSEKKKKKDSRVPSLLREAAEWHLLACLLTRPRDGWQQELSSSAAETSDTLIQSACSAARIEATEGIYHSIFGPGGPAAPREASYRTTLQLGYVLSELESFYNAFGYSPDPSETPDHVSVETDFVAYLLVKEALALSKSDVERAEIAASARNSFLETHLSLIAEPLQQGLTHSGVRYLQIASVALLNRVGPPGVETGPPQNRTPDLVQIEDPEFSCG